MGEGVENADGLVFVVMLSTLIILVPFIIVVVICLAILHYSVVLPWYLSRYLFRRGVQWYR